MSRDLEPVGTGTSDTLEYEDLERLMSEMTGDAKHSGAATSTLDVLWVLHDRVLRINPADPGDSNRDRFYLSKGHGPTAYYAVLAAKGFIEPEHLATFGMFDSVLGRTRLAGRNRSAFRDRGVGDDNGGRQGSR